MKRLAVVAMLTVVAASLSMGLKIGFTRSAIGPGIVITSSEEADDLKGTLVNLEKQSWEAWKKRDGAYFQNFLSDDHVEVGFYGTTNKARVVKGVSSSACVVNSYSVDNFQLTAFDANTALLTYHAAQDTTCGGNAVPSPVWVSSLYVKRDGHWLNALYQQTKDLRKPAN